MVNKIHEPVREIDVVDRADIVILGGGPAGCAAAVAAGRLGADVLLVERYGCLGGVATGGLVILLDSYGKRGEILMSGLAVEFLDRLKERGVARTPEWFRLENPVYCPETLKFVSLDMAEKANVRLLFHAWAVGAHLESNNIEAVIIESKSGRQALHGKFFIDCTGDGDTAAWAGVPHENIQSPLGLGIQMRWGNVDFEKYRRFTQDQKDEWTKIMGQAKAEGIGWPPKPSWRNDRAWFITVYPGDALNVNDLTRCEIDLRKNLMKLYDFYRERMPGFEDATIIDTSSQIGTRESRRIMGEYVMTGEDVPGGRFDDTIGTGVTWTGKGAGEPFDFPYRALVPQKIENLLFAGRCISASHEAHQNTRVIPNCWATGQGAGVACTVALENDVPCRAISITQLQERLGRQGVAAGGR